MAYYEVIGLGRLQPSNRMSFETLLARLREEYRAALMDMPRKKAFDSLVRAWSEEAATYTYAESFKLIDLVILTGLVDDRRIYEELVSRVAGIGDRLATLEVK
jgi:hypothetical protein